MKKNIAPFIEIKNLTKKFGHKIANKNITITINEGEKIGLIGANGAGKTTLVEQIIGTSKPTSGKIVYHFDYHKTPQEKMGMQFQDSSYPEGVSVKDVIDFSLNIYGSEIEQKELEHLLDVFKIRDFYKLKAKGLSGGQQQKLNVLLAIAHKPKFVILDEISTGLDISAKEEILKYVEKEITNNNTTTILISHNMSEIKRLCNRVIILKDGQIAIDASVFEIEKKYKSLDNLAKKLIEGEINVKKNERKSK